VAHGIIHGFFCTVYDKFYFFFHLYVPKMGLYLCFLKY
jgi:hypothetical protein